MCSGARTTTYRVLIRRRGCVEATTSHTRQMAALLPFVGALCLAYWPSRVLSQMPSPGAHAEVAYIVQSRTDEKPILAHTSYVAGPQNSDWYQVFNPTYVQASPATGNRTGLLVRSQNCELLLRFCCFCALANGLYAD